MAAWGGSDAPASARACRRVLWTGGGPCLLSPSLARLAPGLLCGGGFSINCPPFCVSLAFPLAISPAT